MYNIYHQNSSPQNAFLCNQNIVKKDDHYTTSLRLTVLVLFSYTVLKATSSDIHTGVMVSEFYSSLTSKCIPIPGSYKTSKQQKDSKLLKTTRFEVLLTKIQNEIRFFTSL